MRIPAKFLVTAIFTALAIHGQAQDSSAYLLLPGADIYLPPGGHTTFMLLKKTKALEEYTLAAENLSSQWTVNGIEYDKQDKKFGKLSLKPLSTNTADYDAPSVPPGAEPILVAIAFTEKDVDAKSTNKMKNFLLCRIHLLDAPNFFSLGGDNDKAGSVYELHEPLTRKNDLAEVALYGQGQWSISVSGFEKDMKSGMRPMSFGLSFAGNGKGTYPFMANGTRETGIRPPMTVVTVNGMGGGRPFQYVSTDCTPHDNPHECDPHTLKGTVTITEFDEKNKIIRGYFYGQLMSPDYQYQYVSGGFRAYMK
jgi:hypothetical protein